MPNPDLSYLGANPERLMRNPAFLHVFKKAVEKLALCSNNSTHFTTGFPARLLLIAKGAGKKQLSYSCCSLPSRSECSVGVPSQPLPPRQQALSVRTS